MSGAGTKSLTLLQLFHNCFCIMLTRTAPSSRRRALEGGERALLRIGLPTDEWGLLACPQGRQLGRDMRCKPVG